MTDAQITDQEFKKYIKRLVNMNRKRNVAVRGTINGIFTALGATIGFALVILISAQLLSSLRQVSIIDQILSETKLDVLIESQLKQIQEQELEKEEENEAEQPVDNNDDSNSEQSYYLSYENRALDLNLNYPASLTNFSEYELESLNGKDSSILSFEGFGILKSIAIYVNPDSFDIVGDSVNFDIESSLVMDDPKISVYERGAVVNGDTITEPVLYYKFVKDTNEFYMVAKGDSSTPKIAREIFITVAESVR